MKCQSRRNSEANSKVQEKETPIQELNADWNKLAEAQKNFTQIKTVPGPLKDKQITLCKFQRYQ